jgi:AmmeMemoRadiSam system protein A
MRAHPHDPDSEPGLTRDEAGNASGLEIGPCRFGEPEQRWMLELAREALTAAITRVDSSSLSQAPPGLDEHKSCFVTLTKHGELRGCVGNLMPHGTLHQMIVENARRAALRDPRFPPVQPGELAEVKIEISVLSEARPLSYGSPEELLGLLQPHQDGVLLRIGSSVAMFLPQVWQHLPDKVQFLERLAQKAGYPPSAWREKDTSVSVYSVQSFSEN